MAFLVNSFFVALVATLLTIASLPGSTEAAATYPVGISTRGNCFGLVATQCCNGYQSCCGSLVDIAAFQCGKVLIPLEINILSDLVPIKDNCQNNGVQCKDSQCINIVALAGADKGKTISKCCQAMGANGNVVCGNQTYTCQNVQKGDKGGSHGNIIPAYCCSKLSC